jgi:hypothetical protein
VNRFIGHSQVVTTNNYNTLKITLTITQKIKRSTSACSRCLVTIRIWIFNYWTVFWILLQMNLWPNWIETESKSESYVTTDGESASLSWNKAPIWGLRSDFYYCMTVAGLLVWGILSDERTGLSFAIAADPRQRSKPRGTRDHILLSQIRDFPFRRLLRLPGLRWRYSTPPPQGSVSLNSRMNSLFWVTR